MFCKSSLDFLKLLLLLNEIKYYLVITLELQNR